MNRAAFQYCTTENRSPIRFGRIAGVFIALLLRETAGCGDRVYVTLASPDKPCVCLADLGRRLDKRVEDRLQVKRRSADNFQDVGGRRLLLQRLAQLVEQPRVLDGDDGMGGEILKQLDLPLGEGTHLLAVDDDGADELAVLEHRHTDKRARPRLFDGDNTQRGPRGIGGIRFEIGDMKHPFFANDAAEAGVRARADRPVLFPELTIGLRDVVQMCRVKAFAVIEQDVTELGFAEAHGVREHRLEDRFHITGRRADDFENVSRGSLLLQRLAQLVQQPRVLDGDDGLRGEGLHQLDLLVGEGTHLLAEYGDEADQFVPLEHWHSQHRASAGKIYKFDVGFIALEVGWTGPNIVDMRNLLGSGDVPKAALRMGTDHLIKPHRELWCGIVDRNPVKGAAVVKIQRTEAGLADPRGVFQNGLEHWLQLAR